MTSADGSRGILDLGAVRSLYDRLARGYDLMTAPHRAIGGYRLVDRAVEELGLRRGATVVDLGTGTGYALPALAARVGPTGRVIGIDISSKMLGRARERCRQEVLANVQLVQADIATYRLPQGTGAVLSAFAMEMLPDHADVIADLAGQLPAGRVTEAYRSHRPWEPMEQHTSDTTYTEILGGVVYLSVGTVWA